jgi:hypothetical protein
MWWHPTMLLVHQSCLRLLGGRPNSPKLPVNDQFGELIYDMQIGQLISETLVPRH